MVVPSSPAPGHLAFALHGDAVDVQIQVVPRASKTRAAGLHGDRIKIQLAAPPVDGAANTALLEFLAQVLGVSKRDVELVRGQASKRKTVRVRGLTPTQIAGKLGVDVGATNRSSSDGN